jgi:curved DNA-binding protein CbpA
MDIDKDYYAILGVLPSAEEIVIKAAYRALSKRYHPDVYKGPNLVEKMADINEAYETLSSADGKAAYDEARGTKSQDADEYFNDDFGTHNTVDPLDADWKVAVKYHPDLENAFAKLTKYSNKLAYSFKAYMLENKKFNNISEVARGLEAEFLSVYFGKNKQVISFAKELFSYSQINILLELNKAVKVLGSDNVDERVINKIKSNFSYDGKKVKKAYEKKEPSYHNFKEHYKRTTGVSLSNYPKEKRETLYGNWRRTFNN